MLPFDERLRTVEALAVGEVRRQMEARGVNRGYLRPEHLALGLLDDPEIIELFNAHGVTEDVRRVAAIGINHPWRDVVDGDEPRNWEVHHTSQTHVIQSIAQAEAKRLGHATVSPLHLALALVLDESSLVSQALIDSGRDAAIRAQLLATLETQGLSSGSTPAERLASTRAAIRAAAQA